MPTIEFSFLIQREPSLAAYNVLHFNTFYIATIIVQQNIQLVSFYLFIFFLYSKSLVFIKKKSTSKIEMVKHIKKKKKISYSFFLFMII